MMGARKAEGLEPRSRRAPLASRQSVYGFFYQKTFFWSLFRVELIPMPAERKGQKSELGRLNPKVVTKRQK